MSIVQIRHVDENLHEVAKIAASQRGVTLNRYFIQAIEVLVNYDGQTNEVVKLALAGGKRSTGLPNGAAIGSLVAGGVKR